MTPPLTEVELVQYTCAESGCGISFWVTKGYSNRRKEDHTTFYCPNGHEIYHPKPKKAKVNG